MPKFSTHYDTLKVDRNASREAIRAAYKNLARQHHPDRNGDSPESHRMMQKINASFEVLNEPYRRYEHDEWIAEQEEGWAGWLKGFRQWIIAFSNRFAAWSFSVGRGVKHVGGHSQVKWIAAAVLVLAAVWFMFQRDLPSNGNGSSSAFATESNVSPAPTNYQRPATAPNGNPWPGSAAEIGGYAVEANDGKSEIIIDNSINATDVFLKLVSLDRVTATPVRHIYLPAHSTYRCGNIRKGSYEIRYKDLASGSPKKSQPFTLVETITERNVTFSSVRLKLNKLADGQMQGYPISEHEF